MSKSIPSFVAAQSGRMRALSICCGLASLLAASLLFTEMASSAVIHRYDFEQATGSDTEAGWTHMATNIAGTPTTAGFLPAAEGSINAFNRIPSIQPPFDLIEDVIISFSGPTIPGSDMVFRDIIPAGVDSVQLTIYRNDPLDNFIANFITQVSINGGPLTTIDTGIAGNGFYHAPISTSLGLPVSNSIQTLDFYFFDGAINSSQVRINGIQAIYSFPPAPEPSSLVLWGLMTAGFGVLRRRGRSAC
jgi:hypothetical protein